MTNTCQKRALPVGCAEWNRDRFKESFTFGSLALDMSQNAPATSHNPSSAKVREFKIIYGGSEFNEYAAKRSYTELGSVTVDDEGIEYLENNYVQPCKKVHKALAWRSAYLRKVAIFVAAGIFLMVFNPFARLNPSALPPNVSSTHPLVITVQPGDTLWSIAQRVEPGKDPRPLVDLLNSATGGKPIDPGQTIVLK